MLQRGIEGKGKENGYHTRTWTQLDMIVPLDSNPLINQLHTPGNGRRKIVEDPQSNIRPVSFQRPYPKGPCRYMVYMWALK